MVLAERIPLMKVFMVVVGEVEDSGFTEHTDEFGTGGAQEGLAEAGLDLAKGFAKQEYWLSQDKDSGSQSFSEPAIR